MKQKYDFYKQLHDLAPCGILYFTLEPPGVIKDANPAAIKMFGLSEGEFWSQERLHYDFIQAEFTNDVKLSLQELHGAEPGTVVTSEYKILGGDGHALWVHSTTQIVTDQSGRQVYQSILTDIAKLKKREEKLRTSEEQYSIAIKTSHHQIFRYDAKKKESVFLSKATGALSQISSDIAPARMIEEGNIAPESVDGYIRFFDEISDGKSQGSAQFRIKKTNGEFSWFRANHYNKPDDSGRNIQTICVFSDITEMKRHEEKLYGISRQDSLTSLYNRKAFEDIVTIEINRQNAQQCNNAFIMIDIDDFKLINDTYGHSLGDEALICAAEIIRKCLGEDDIIARLGGDEFAIFMKNIPSSDYIQKRGNEICAKFLSLIAYHELSCSIGYAISPQHGNDFKTLYENADKALYNAKRRGKNMCCEYENEQ